MRKRVQIIPIFLILVLFLFIAGKQLVADFYYRMAHKQGRDPNEIIRYLENCILIDKKNPSFHFSLGRVFLRKGLVKATKTNEKSRWLRESIYEFRKAIDLRPSSGDYHLHLGISYGSLGYPPFFYWKIIQNSFDRTIMLNSTDVRHLYSIGIYYLNEYHRLKNTDQNTDRGLAHYGKYVTLSKDNYQFFFSKLLDVDEDYLIKILENIFSVTKRYTDLEAVIRDISRDHAMFARFLYNRGMWKEAKNEYMMAIKLEPSNSILYGEFADVLSRMNDFKNAITWWQKQKVLNPQDERIYLSLSYAFMRLNRFDDAVRELRELVRLDPENINYHVKLVKTLLDARRVDEAIDEYRKIVEKNENLSKSMYDKICYYQGKGNYLKAVDILNEALMSALNK